MTIKKNNTFRTAVSAIAVAGLLTSLTACNGNEQLSPKTILTDSAMSTTAGTADISFPVIADSSSENSHLGDRPAYDDVFKGINSSSSTGAPMPYDEAMEMITSPFQKENGIYLDSFYIVETVRVLPYEEARNLNGWTEICEGKTMYEVKLLKDLISGETVNRTEKIIAATGTVEWQNDGDPVYAPGEKFTVALTKPQENCDFLQTPVSSMFRYDVVEDATGTTLYSRKSEIDKLNLPAAANIDEEIITSTTQNPAVHSQKVGLDTLADFLRSDWEQRGVSAHFEKCAQTASKTELPRETEQSAQKIKEETTALEQTKPTEETSAYVTEYIPLSSLSGAEKPDELPHYTFEEAERLTEEELIGLAQSIRTASSEDFIADYTAVDDMGVPFDRSYQILIAPITVETDNDFEEYCRVRADAAMRYTEYENETTEKLGENKYYAEWSNTYTEIRRMFSNDVPVERHIDRAHRSVFLKNFRLDEGSVVYCGEMTAEEIRANFDLLLSSSLMLARRVTETDEAFFYETVSAHIVGGDWGLNDSIVFGVRRYAIFKGEGVFYAMDRDAETVFEAEYEIPGTARDLEWE